VFSIQYYAREDDPLRESLLGEGKALWQLVGRPLIHGALPHSSPPEAPEQLSDAVVTLAAVCAAGGERVRGVDGGWRAGRRSAIIKRATRLSQRAGKRARTERRR
jgi:hypothetical protein